MGTIHTSYKVRIKNYNRIFDKTVSLYRGAADFLTEVCLKEWDAVSVPSGKKERVNIVERLTHATKDNPSPKYPEFDVRFYKFPSYLRRAAISDALGRVSSYKTALAQWEEADSHVRGRRPGMASGRCAWPCLYRGNMYERTGVYTAKVKVFIRNTWDWLEIGLDKGDADYIQRHCGGRRECSPTILKRGKKWFLVFPFEEGYVLDDASVFGRTIAAVDLGVGTAATVCVMKPEGTILGRRFLHLPGEEDSLAHAVNRIKKAQRGGAVKTPRLWARANGINDDMAAKTAEFIVDTALAYGADVIVFEYLELRGRKRGSKKQRLHLWRAGAVQAMVTDKAHRNGIHVSRVCARDTSRLAFDGSGRVLRGREISQNTPYCICRFAGGKIYNADLNASYNIGARYFIREITKSIPETEWSDIAAKVPRCRARSTCTLSDLISLYAAVCSYGEEPLSSGRMDGDIIRCA